MEKVSTDIDEPIELYVPNIVTLSEELVNIQCSEIEYIVEFNKSFSREDYGEGFWGCSSMGMRDSSDEDIPSELSVSWDWAEVDPNNICIVHKMTGFVCIPGVDELPEEWQSFCGFDDDEVMDGDSSAGDE